MLPARYTPLTSIAIFGGVPVARQVCALRLDGIEVLMFYEADHMFDMGFLPDVRRILTPTLTASVARGARSRAARPSP